MSNFLCINSPSNGAEDVVNLIAEEANWGRNVTRKRDIILQKCLSAYLLARFKRIR